jgi:hypothetical protein
VTGIDAANSMAFSLAVEAISETDAKLVACAGGRTVRH